MSRYGTRPGSWLAQAVTQGGGGRTEAEAQHMARSARYREQEHAEFHYNKGQEVIGQAFERAAEAEHQRYAQAVEDRRQQSAREAQQARQADPHLSPLERAEAATRDVNMSDPDALIAALQREAPDSEHLRRQMLHALTLREVRQRQADRAHDARQSPQATTPAPTPGSVARGAELFAIDTTRRTRGWA